MSNFKFDSYEGRLLSPYQLGPFKLSNRVVFSPCTRGRAAIDTHIPTDIMCTYYSQRCNAGLIIVEATGISQQGLGWQGAPGIWSYDQSIGWKKVCQCVRQQNPKCVMFCQLWHQGRTCHSDVTGQTIVSSSATALPGEVTTIGRMKKPYETPHALTIDEIRSVVKNYTVAAENAINIAGFDGIELHAANGYLIDQFIETGCNKREDKYGGSIENRLRFLKEIVNSILDSDNGITNKQIGVRLSPNMTVTGTDRCDNIEIFTKAIEFLAEKNILYVDIRDGIGFADADHGAKRLFTLERVRNILDKYKRIKNINNININKGCDTAIMASVGYDRESGEKVLEKGYCDLVGYGRYYMSNPDLVYRFKNKIKLNPYPKYKYWYFPDKKEKGYIDFQKSKL